MKGHSHRWRATSLILSGLVLSAGAAASDPQFMGDFGAWSAYEVPGEGECYIASKPLKEEGDYQRRGEVYMLVLHRPADDVSAEVSVIAGYDYDDSRDPVATIGRSEFAFMAKGGQAWVRSEHERAMVDAMRRGSEMVVRGTSRRGTLTTDTYSLIGFSKALEAIDEACRPGS